MDLQRKHWILKLYLRQKFVFNHPFLRRNDLFWRSSEIYPIGTKSKTHFTFLFCPIYFVSSFVQHLCLLRTVCHSAPEMWKKCCFMAEISSNRAASIMEKGGSFSLFLYLAAARERTAINPCGRYKVHIWSLIWILWPIEAGRLNELRPRMGSSIPTLAALSKRWDRSITLLMLYVYLYILL